MQSFHAIKPWIYGKSYIKRTMQIFRSNIARNQIFNRNTFQHFWFLILFFVKMFLNPYISRQLQVLPNEQWHWMFEKVSRQYYCGQVVALNSETTTTFLRTILWQESNFYRLPCAFLKVIINFYTDCLILKSRGFLIIISKKLGKSS